MPKELLNEPIRGELVFLGTGTSHGVPLIGCGCPVCRSDDPRNKRTRCAVVLGLPFGNLLIDTPPELRLQLVRERIGVVHAVAYTHGHADHLFGLDDLRIMNKYLGGGVPLFCEEQVENRIRRAFDYAFSEESRRFPHGGVPLLQIRRIGTEPFELLGAEIVPVRLAHGRWDILGFRIGNTAYCTDVKTIPESSKERLRDLDCLILDCLRKEPHPTHMSLDEALAAVEELRPKRCYFTHMCHRLDHAETEANLPENVRLAYDGLRIPLTGIDFPTLEDPQAEIPSPPTRGA
ncbi:MAG: MBL fold metallo-hydrolase [Planctomycetota bacterium]|nr:MAG: MBL fold metallo-hydrolase [Planctomycetota bacterium]